MADKPKVENVATSVPATVAAQMATETAPPTAQHILRAMFRPASWQPKDAGSRRLAECDIYGAFGDRPIVLSGFAVAMNAAREVIVYLPSASRVGSQKAVAPANRFIDDPDGGKIAVPSKAGQAAVEQLTAAILAAYRSAELTSVGPFDRLIDLQF